MKRIPILAAILLCWLAASNCFADSPIRPGDRIAIVGNTFADQLREHGYLETLLLQHSVQNPISIRNLGWGGDTLTQRERPANFPAEEIKLVEHKTDVIIACFGMGESFAGQDELEQFRSDLKAFIASHASKQYNGQSDVRLILVSPIACEDLGSSLTPQHKQRIKDLRDYTEAMRQVASEANVSFIDLYEPSRQLMNQPNSDLQLTTNGIHLNPVGYWAISQSFFDQLVGKPIGKPRPSAWELQVDATAKSTDSRGVEIEELEVEDSDLSFRVIETSTPGLAPPTKQSLSPPLESTRDKLTVNNLQPGEYRLTIDGTPVASASAKQWASGVPVDSSPAHETMEAYKAVVNDKNLQFVYGWKAMNQVHIVGERRTSASGQALPGEIIEFNQMADELDETLSRGVELTTRTWRLTRVEEDAQAEKE